MQVKEPIWKQSEAVLGAPRGIDDRAVIRIDPPRGWAFPDVLELWHYRELLYFFIWRDIKVRYRQTILGAAWAIMPPLLTMVAFSVLFGKVARLPSSGVPYPVFSYAALVPWAFFATGLSKASNSLLSNAHLMKKVYFPRLIMPMAAVLGGAVDFLLAFVILLAMVLHYGFVPKVNALLLPLFFLLALVTSLGLGLWFSALNARFRDVGHAVPFLIQFWLLATPIAYPSSLLPEPWRTIYGINPMAGVVEGFRWALLGTNTASATILCVSTLAALTLLLTGVLYFCRMENMLVDVV